MTPFYNFIFMKYRKKTPLRQIYQIVIRLAKKKDGPKIYNFFVVLLVDIYLVIQTKKYCLKKKPRRFEYFEIKNFFFKISETQKY